MPRLVILRQLSKGYLGPVALVNMPGRVQKKIKKKFRNTFLFADMSWGLFLATDLALECRSRAEWAGGKALRSIEQDA